MKQIPRELTAAERREIRRLVGHCANYDSEYGCLPLDYGGCYMLDKWWTGSLCRYFESSVLPENPVLEQALKGEPPQDTKALRGVRKAIPGGGAQGVLFRQMPGTGPTGEGCETGEKVPQEQGQDRHGLDLTKPLFTRVCGHGTGRAGVLPLPALFWRFGRDRQNP